MQKAGTSELRHPTLAPGGGVGDGIPGKAADSLGRSSGGRFGVGAAEDMNSGKTGGMNSAGFNALGQCTHGESKQLNWSGLDGDTGGAVCVRPSNPPM